VKSRFTNFQITDLEILIQRNGEKEIRQRSSRIYLEGLEDTRLKCRRIIRPIARPKICLENNGEGVSFGLGRTGDTRRVGEGLRFDVLQKVGKGEKRMAEAVFWKGPKKRGEQKISR